MEDELRNEQEVDGPPDRKQGHNKVCDRPDGPKGFLAEQGRA